MRRGFLKTFLSIFGITEESVYTPIFLYLFSLSVTLLTIHLIINYSSLILGYISIPSINFILMFPGIEVANLLVDRYPIDFVNLIILLVVSTLSLLTIGYFIDINTLPNQVSRFTRPRWKLAILILIVMFSSAIFILLYKKLDKYVPYFVIGFTVLTYLFLDNLFEYYRRFSEGINHTPNDFVILFRDGLIVLALGSLINLISILVFTLFTYLPFLPSIDKYMDIFYYITNILFPIAILVSLVLPLGKIVRFIISDKFLGKAKVFSISSITLLFAVPIILWFAGIVIKAGVIYAIIFLTSLVLGIGYLFGLPALIESIFFLIGPIALVFLGSKISGILSFLAAIVNIFVAFILFLAIYLIPLFYLPRVIIKVVNYSYYADPYLSSLYTESFIVLFLNFVFSIILSVLLVIFATYALQYVLQIKEYSSFFVLYYLSIIIIAYVSEVFRNVRVLANVNLPPKESSISQESLEKIENKLKFLGNYDRFVSESIPLFFLVLLALVEIPSLNMVGNSILSSLGLNVNLPTYSSSNINQLTSLFPTLLSSPFSYSKEFVNSLSETEVVVPNIKTKKIEEYKEYTYSIEFEEFSLNYDPKIFYANPNNLKLLKVTSILRYALIYDAPPNYKRNIVIYVCKPICYYVDSYKLDVKSLTINPSNSLEYLISADLFLKNSLLEAPVVLTNCTEIDVITLKGNKIYKKHVSINFELDLSNINISTIYRNRKRYINCDIPIVMFFEYERPYSKYIIYISPRNILKDILGYLYKDILPLIIESYRRITYAQKTPFIIKISSLLKLEDSNIPVIEIPEVVLDYCKTKDNNLYEYFKDIPFYLLFDFQVVNPKDLGIIKNLDIKGFSTILNLSTFSFKYNSTYLPSCSEGDFKCEENNEEYKCSIDLSNQNVQEKIKGMTFVNLEKNIYKLGIVTGLNRGLSDITKTNPLICTIKPFYDKTKLNKLCEVFNTLGGSRFIDVLLEASIGDILYEIYTTKSLHIELKLYENE